MAEGDTNLTNLVLSGDLTASDDLTVTDTLDVNGDIDLDGDGFDVDITAGFSIDADAASNINVAGAGIDLTLESEAGSIVIKGDEAVATAITLDANEAAGTGITMATGATSGYALTGGPFDVNVTGAISLDADLASNLNAAAGDITVEAETGSVVIKGDEAVADAISLDANEAAGTGVTIVTGATGGLNISGGMTTISNGITGVVNVENIMLPTVLSVAITYTAAAGGTGTVATIADGEIWIVHSVFARVTTNFDCTGDDATLVVGDGNDADGFLVLADTELQAADTEGTGFAAGWQGMTAATIGDYLENAGGGFIYAPSGAPETIDWLVDEVSGETLTAGAATIYVVYTRIA